MATYTELFTLSTDATLLGKVEVAVMVAAQGFLADANATNEQIAWAQQTILNRASTAATVLPLVLAASRASTVAQINAATDATLQTSVNNIVAKLTLGKRLPA